LKIFVLIEIPSSVVSAKSKEVTGPFVGGAESKGVRTQKEIKTDRNLVQWGWADLNPRVIV